MFSKLKLKQGVKVDQHQNLQMTQYHATNAKLAKSNSQWDHGTLAKVPLSYNDNLKLQDKFNFNKKKIENLVNQYVKMFKKALEHDCFNDIISRNDIENKVTVAFLPISTSDSVLSNR